MGHTWVIGSDLLFYKVNDNVTQQAKDISYGLYNSCWKLASGKDLHLLVKQQQFLSLGRFDVYHKYQLMFVKNCMCDNSKQMCMHALLLQCI